MKKILPICFFIIACSGSEHQQLSKQEYKAFGQIIIKTIKSGNSKKLSNCLYLNETYGELVEQIDSMGYMDRVSKAKWKSYRVELRNNFSKYLETLINLTKDGGTIELSKYYVTNNRPHLIFTVYSVSKAYEIVDFELITLRDQTFITDYKSFKNGIQFSDAFIWDATNKLKFGWLGGEYINALEELHNTHIYLKRQESENAWNAINRVPEYFLYYSNFQVLKLAAAAQISDSLYATTLAEWIGYNWDQAGFKHLRSFEYYSFIGDSSSALSSLDSLELMVGENDLLDELRK